ncbi:MAG: hypothetical protein ABIP03_04765, partial [Aquihabitans sp.]
RLAAIKAAEFGVPIRHLTNDELLAGEAGFVGHGQGTAVGYGGTHTDPGPDFPWDRYIALVQSYAQEATPMATVVTAFGLKLDSRSAAIARAVYNILSTERPDIAKNFWGIPGFGSYVQNAASAGIDAGGGHGDWNAEPWTDEQGAYVAKTFRRCGATASLRKRSWYSPMAGRTLSPGWQRHVHVTFKGVPDATLANRNQVRAITTYGQDGLARKVNGYDVDRDDRTFVNSTFETFTKLATVIVNLGGTIVVQGMQKAVRQTADGSWGIQTDIALRNTRAAALDNRYFMDSRWNADLRKRMQTTWGATPDGVWGPATKAALEKTVVALQGAMGQARDGQWGKVTDAAFLSLRAKHYAGADKDLPAYEAPAPVVTRPAPAPVNSTDVDISNIGVGLTAPISMANMKVGKQGGDVGRYQCALWNRLPSAVRQEFVTKYGLKRSDLYDGDYGKVTSAMTARLYTLIELLPASPEPGPKLMRFLGFTTIR